MDIISHALWSGALFKSVNLKLKRKKFNFWWAAFWGMFPDLFAFVIPYIIFFVIIISGKGFVFSNLSSTLQSPPYSGVVEMLYAISHSLVIFTIVFLLMWIIFRKPVWILFGWLLHILIDIPTHLIGHFATPMFWPISNFRVNGLIYWREPLFIIIDVILLVVVYWIILSKEIKLRNKRR
jgi:hypothetical protein